MGAAVDVHSRIGPGRPEEARTVEAALREMDAAGVAVSWVCPGDAWTAIRNEEGNRWVAAAVRAHPDRFVGCAAANPWWGDEAAAILRRGFDEGLRVLYVHSALQGFSIDDPLVDPLIASAVAHRAPIYVHTGTPVAAEPLQLAALARRHPEARFILGHMGYADFWYDAIPAAQAAQNVWIETSLADPDLLLEGINTLGPQRFVFGSDAPRSDVGVEAEELRRLPIAAAALARILGGTAGELLR